MQSTPPAKGHQLRRNFSRFHDAHRSGSNFPRCPESRSQSLATRGDQLRIGHQISAMFVVSGKAHEQAHFANSRRVIQPSAVRMMEFRPSCRVKKANAVSRTRSAWSVRIKLLLRPSMVCTNIRFCFRPHKSAIRLPERGRWRINPPASSKNRRWDGHSTRTCTVRRNVEEPFYPTVLGDQMSSRRRKRSR